MVELMLSPIPCDSTPPIFRRARIDAIRERIGGDDEELAASSSRKKLSDVRPDPKVAASLGLKVAAFAPRAKPAHVAASAAPDLMGGLDSPPRVSNGNLLYTQGSYSGGSSLGPKRGGGLVDPGRMCMKYTEEQG